MPRKAKLIKKDEGKIIQEKPPLTQEEINSLEQMLEKDEEKIDSSELKDFLNESKTKEFLKEQKIGISSSSPSLKKINAPQRNPVRLETNIIETPAPNNNLKEEENGSFKYNPTERKPEGPKYIKYEGAIIENMLPRMEIQNIGKEKPFERRTIGFETSPQARISVQETFEKYTPAAKVDKDKIGKEKLFEKKETKYTPEKY